MYKINKEFHPIIIINFNSTDNNDNNLEEFKKDYLKLLISAKENSLKLVIIYNNVNVDNIDTNRFYKLYLFFQSIRKENCEHVRKICLLNNNTSLNLMIKSMTPLNKIRDDVPYKVFGKENDLIKYINNKYNKTIFLS